MGSDGIDGGPKKPKLILHQGGKADIPKEPVQKKSPEIDRAAIEKKLADLDMYLRIQEFAGITEDDSAQERNHYEQNYSQGLERLAPSLLFSNEGDWLNDLPFYRALSRLIKVKLPNE